MNPLFNQSVALDRDEPNEEKLPFRDELPLLRQPMVGPEHSLHRESPKARAMLYMKARGMQNKEIAVALGLHPSTVGRTSRQLWFVENLAKLLHARGIDSIDELLKAQVPEALSIALELMRESKSDNVRSRCAFELLKLAHGTKVKISTEVPKDHLDEAISRLEQEIAALAGNSAKS